MKNIILEIKKLSKTVNLKEAPIGAMYKDLEIRARGILDKTDDLFAVREDIYYRSLRDTIGAIIIGLKRIILSKYDISVDLTSIENVKDETGTIQKIVHGIILDSARNASYAQIDSHLEKDKGIATFIISVQGENIVDTVKEFSVIIPKSMSMFDARLMVQRLVYDKDMYNGPKEFKNYRELFEFFKGKHNEKTKKNLEIQRLKYLDSQTDIFSTSIDKLIDNTSTNEEKDRLISMLKSKIHKLNRMMFL